MASENRMTEGCVIEFADKGKFHLGLVMSFEEKTGKVKLINVLGRDVSLASKQVLHILPVKISRSLLPGNIQTELKSLDVRADEYISKCDIEELWSLVLDDYDEISLDDLASMMFDAPGAVEILGMIRALRQDKIYFKTISPELFSPRSREIVEDLLRQQEAKARREAWRSGFADEAISLLKMSENDRIQAVEDEIRNHSVYRDAWKSVEHYAIFGGESPEKMEAEVLLELIQNRLNHGFSGTSHLKARAFLREAGFWTKNTNVALLKYEVIAEFSELAEKEALECFRSSAADMHRRNLTHLNVFSIDDSDTLDIDDALSIEAVDGGKWRLGVHIAAPASSISFNSVLEHEARRRGTSIYLPEQRIPMIPLILSENALSLMPGERRNAISFLLTFDSEYNLIAKEIVPSVVSSRHRLSYDLAEHLLEEGDDNLSDELRKIQEISEVSAESRRSHGAIDIDLPEFKLDWDETTSKYILKPIDTSMMSRQIVSECMILANALAAEFCFEHEIPALYRIQAAPNNMPRQETLDAMPNDLIRAYSMRRCMMPAVSSMTPGLHAGLGIDKYLQATSPLRRYADLMAHYQLENWFSDGCARFDEETFNAILAETDLGLSHARSASHEAYQTATLKYLEQLGNQPLDAVIVQYNSERGDIAQVALVETQIRANVATKNRWPVGTMCRVKIDCVRPEEDVIILQFVDVVNS